MIKKNKILLSCLFILYVTLFSMKAFAVERSNILSLPDTGQTVSYTDTYGEDSNFSINPPSYTDNGNGLVTDNVTGLMWQKEDDDTAKTWDDAVGYCNNLTLGDLSDWRLPDSLELVTIVNSATYRSSIKANYFPNTNASEYWSSTTDSKYASLAWTVNFNYGEIFHFSKSSSYFVRCVRGGNTQQAQKGKSYTDNGDNSVTDNSTGLMWQQIENSRMGGMDWESAISYCENLSLAGYNDWRLPNYKELGSLIDYQKNFPAIDTAYFPNVQPNSFSGYYWTSTTNIGNPYHAWFSHFASGQMAFCNKSIRFLVRCVRSEQDERSLAFHKSDEP